jgi:glycosyltransferase involved in cell wall biosynthesis
VPDEIEPVLLSRAAAPMTRQASGSVRVLFVVDGLAGGGAERTVLRLASELVGRGHEVGVASLRPERAYPVPEGVTLIDCFDTSPRRLRKIREVRRRARLLDRALGDRPEWDLAVSTLLTTDRIVRASHLAKSCWYRVPNPLSVEQLDSVAGFKKVRRRARLKATYDGQKVIAISAGVARDLVENAGVSPGRLEVIHNPFDVEEIRRLAEEPCRSEPEDYLLAVGRFSRQKRYDRLLGSFARSRYSGRLVIVGTGTGQQIRAVAEQARSLGLASRVDLVGFDENPYPYMKHARALVLSSDFEGFGNVLVESLVCGTPVVSTRCPHGPEEILAGGLSVGLADLTEESLAEAIDRVIEDPPPITDEHLRPFGVRAIADRYLALGEEGPTAGTDPA